LLFPFILEVLKTGERLMPTQVSYPGVYIEEIPSGVRTITGVATSIACFVGWAPKGPTDREIRITNFSDYVRYFGQIHPKSYLGYSVKQFFANGGSDAYVVRVVDGNDTENEVATCSVGGLTFAASSPGEWAGGFGIFIKKREAPGPIAFQLNVVEFARESDGSVDTTRYDVVETFNNLSTSPDSPRYVKEVVNDERSGSLYARYVSGDDVDSAKATEFAGGSAKVPDDIDDPSSMLGSIKKLAEEESVLDRIDLFNLLCVPGVTDADTLSVLSVICERRRAMLLADPDKGKNQSNLGIPTVARRKNSALFFPWLRASDDLSEGRLTDFPPCGFMAGLFARTDATRGVWKAPAGTEATLAGVNSPQQHLTDKENGILNKKGVNCIRSFPVYGTIAWGARTLDGDDEIGSEWKYIPVRRTALFIEETLFRASKWAVFEPNDEPLWAQLRLNIGAFMNDLFRQGAFQGRSPRDAYFVKCDKETTTQNDVNKGIVNVVVGFAPLKPAEFVVIKLTQIAGQIEA
jgi:phage tail sheath protein FI